MIDETRLEAWREQARRWARGDAALVALHGPAPEGLAAALDAPMAPPTAIHLSRPPPGVPVPSVGLMLSQADDE